MKLHRKQIEDMLEFCSYAIIFNVTYFNMIDSWFAFNCYLSSDDENEFFETWLRIKDKLDMKPYDDVKKNNWINSIIRHGRGELCSIFC